MEDKIYVVTHKPFTLSDKLMNKGYELITVGGKAKSNKGVTDATGDNISVKNPSYCELTAAYWIWKNTSTDVKGFCHYRRYFSHPTLKYNEDKIISVKEAKNIISKDSNTIILSERKYYNVSAEKLYLQCGYKKDLETTREVIKEKYPEYVTEFDKMMKSNTGYITNMMIASSSIYDAYYKWLFDILFEVEKRTDISSYTPAEARIYGYISERLVDLWVTHNKLNVVEFQSINPETDYGIKYFMYRTSVNLGFYRKLKLLIFKENKK